MSNAFKEGDKIKLTPRSEPLSQLLVGMVNELTDETTFTLTSVGLATHNELEEVLKQPSAEPDCVEFKLASGESIEFSYKDVTLLKVLSKGDKVTVNSTGLTRTQASVTRDTIQGKEYTITATGKAVGEEDEACRFIDDVGDEVTLNSGALTLVS